MHNAKMTMTQPTLQLHFAINGWF